MTPTTAQVTLSLNAAQYFSGMSKVQAEAKTAAAGIASGFTAAQGVLAGFTGVLAATGLGNIITSTANYSKEVERLATLSNQSTREFQGMAYAASTVGIEQDKLADIFKDTQDKVGDFLQNGGGPLKDFFDNIAPRVGVTADQFRNLGGKDALQLYVSSLEKANLSQNEMTFYMEAIASDSTLLLPLLRDNGKAMSDLATEAERLGRVLDDDAIRAGKEFQENLTRLQGAADGLKLKIGNELIPWITKLSNEFLTGTKVAGGFWAAVLNFGTMAPVDSPAEGVKKYREELDKLTAQRERLMKQSGGIEGPTSASMDRLIEKAQQRVNYFDELMRQGWNLSSKAGGGRGGMAQDPRIIGATPTGETVGSMGGGKPAKAGGGKAGKAGKPEDPEDEAKRRLDNLQKQLQATRDLSAEETLLADIQAGRLGDVSAAMKSALVEQAKMLDQAQAQQELDKLTEKIHKDTEAAAARARKEQEALLQSMLDATPTAQLERQRKEMQLLAEAFERGRQGLEGGITAEQFSEAASARLGNVAKDVDKANESAKAFGQIMNSAFEDAIISGGKLSDVVKGLIADLARMALRKSVTEPLAQAASGWIGSFIDGFRADGGPVSAGKTYMVGERGPELFSPATSGFITPNHALSGGGGAGGGVTVVQNISIDARGADASVDQKILAAMRQTKQETLAAVQMSANRGGSFAASVGRA